MKRIAYWLVCLTLGATLAQAQIIELPRVGYLQTAHTLGSGGFSLLGGFVPLETRLPRLGQTAISRKLNVGGVEFDRVVRYESDGGLIPLQFGFGVSEATDFYLNGTLSSGTSRKIVRNFYAVPVEVYGDAPDQYDRLYDQPLFDFGVGLKHQLKPDYGDGLPAVAVGASARFGYASDDFEDFKDLTPEDGYTDFGVEGFLAASSSFGDLLQAHGAFGLSTSRKLGAQLVVSAGGAFALVPDQLVVSADFSTRRDIAGVEYTESMERITIGLQYSLSGNTVGQAVATPEGALLFNLVQLGDKPTGVAPVAPSVEQGLF